MLHYDVHVKTFIEHVNAFIASRTSSHTAANYKVDLRQFGLYMQGDKGHNELLVVTQRTIRNFMVTLAGQSYSPASVARKLAAIKSFFKYLVKQKVTDLNPTVEVLSPRIKRKPPKTLSPNIIGQLVASVQGTSFVAQRDRTILTVLQRVGLLTSEIVSLDWEAVCQQAKVRVVNRYKDKYRILPLDGQTTEILKEYAAAYCKEHGTTHLDPAHALFLNQYGGRLTYRSIARIIKKYAKVCNIVDVSPRTLRASFAKQMLQEGHTLEAVGYLLGHQREWTTSHYTD